MSHQVITLPGAGHADVLSVTHADEPKRPRSWSRRDVVELLLSAVAAAGATGTLFVIMDWRSLVAATIWWFLLFVVIYRIEVGANHGPIVAADRMMTATIAAGGLICFALLVWIVSFVIGKGLPALRPGFFTQDLSKVGPLNPGGGALHAIIGTLEQVGIATAVVVPLAILTAVYLHEMKGRMAPLIRFIVDAMSGLPSIVAGLLVYTIWILQFHRGFSGMAGAVALVVLMLPTVTRTSEEILRTIDDGLRESALALGAPQWRVIARVVLPTARSGLVTAAILGVARGVGETAPMILTAFGSPKTNLSPVTSPQSDLPLFVWSLIRQPNATQIERAWTGALILVFLVLALFTIARVLGEASFGRSRR